MFHHAHGLTPCVIALADQPRAVGHTVHTPALFDGHTFDTLEEGLGYAGRVGFGAVIDRGVRAAEARDGRRSFFIDDGDRAAARTLVDEAADAEGHRAPHRTGARLPPGTVGAEALGRPVPGRRFGQVSQQPRAHAG